MSRQRFEALIENVLFEKASEAECAEFRALLHADPELLDEYLYQLRVHAILAYRAPLASGQVSGQQAAMARRVPRWLKGVAGIAATLMCLAVIGTTVAYYGAEDAPEEEVPVVAVEPPVDPAIIPAYATPIETTASLPDETQASTNEPVIAKTTHLPAESVVPTTTNLSADPTPRGDKKMNTLQKLAATVTALLSFNAIAATNEWTGAAGDGLWFTDGNWSLGHFPTVHVAGGEDVLINVPDAVVSSSVSGTWNIRTSVTVKNGAVWRQTDGTVIPHVHGQIILDGGTLDTGDAAFVRVDKNSMITIRNQGVFKTKGLIQEWNAPTTLRIEESGRFESTVSQGVPTTLQMIGGEYLIPPAGNRTLRAADTYQGGRVAVGGILQMANANASVLLDGTMFQAKEVFFSYLNGAVLNLNAGSIRITDGAADHYGIRNAGGTGAYINFPVGGMGALFITNSTAVTPAIIHSRYFTGANPKIKYNNAAVSLADYELLFDVVTSEEHLGHTKIALKQAEAGAGSFVDNACSVQDVTETSATLTATVADPGEPNAELFACYGTQAGLTDWDAWASVVPLGTAQANTPVSYTASSLLPNHVYYYQIMASNETAVTAALPTPTFFMTGEVGLAADVGEMMENRGSLEVVISRPSDNNCTNVALSVPYMLGGTAVKDTHYSVSPTANPVVIPAGTNLVTLKLAAIMDPASTLDRTIALNLKPSKQYLLAETNAVVLTIRNLPFPGGNTNVFTGTASNEGTNAANWSLGLPASSHVIMFSPDYTKQERLLWRETLTQTVAGWVQPATAPGLTNHYVTFYTTPQVPLHITGDVVLENGRWTHDGPSATPTKAVAIEIGGDLTVEPDAAIHAGLDYGKIQVYWAQPAGYHNAGPGYVANDATLERGASHGGEGVGSLLTYGSILNPMSYGSSGRGVGGAEHAGGGVVILKVGGVATVNGKLCSKGFGLNYAPSDTRGGSAGGSVNLEAARLVGSGIIAADGGVNFNYTEPVSKGSGSGGRVRIKLTAPGATMADFAGQISAYGKPGVASAGVPCSAAGTVCLQSAADATDEGTVIVANNVANPVGVTRLIATHLPPQQDTDASLKKTTWRLQDNAVVRLTGNVQVKVLQVESESAKLLTDGYTLTVTAFSIGGVRQSPGVYTVTELPDLLLGVGEVNNVGDRTVILLQ